MEYKIDAKKLFDGMIHIQGWILPKNLEDTVEFIVKDSSNNDVPFKNTRVKRDDVSEIYLGKIVDNTYFGFDIEFEYDKNVDKTYYLIIKTNSERIKEKINNKILTDFNNVDRKKRELFFAYLNKNTFKRAIDFLFKEGPLQFIKKARRKLKGISVDYDYSEWYELTKTTDEEIDKQRTDNSFKFYPKFSIVIPIYDTEDKYLNLLFKSILNQTYRNFEICIADATDYKISKNNPKIFFEKLMNDTYKLNHYGFVFSDLHIKYLDENKSIADNTNEAIKLSSGDYIVLCDHDDELTVDALYECAKVINDNPSIELIYSDEDKVDMNGETFFEPSFKPDFNLDMLLSVNYFCHLTVIKKTLLDKVKVDDDKYELSEYNGAQDYDLFLRLVNYLINDSYKDGFYDLSKIYHISKVLYHWRCHKNSTSKNVDSKQYAFKNGEKALESFYKNTKIDFPKISKVEKGFDYGLYHTVYDRDYKEPLISVIIPNKDHIDDLKLAISSLLKGNYKNLEFVICENNSNYKETFLYYETLQSEHHNVKVVTYEGAFNNSKINNFTCKYANGEYLLFLNNDVEMISMDSIHEMLSILKRTNVGIVGAKLLYKDNTYQHAGVVLGIGGIADHLFKNISIYDHTYMNRAEIVCDYNAVTAACLMTKKSLFNEVGGFDEDIAVAFNDIDLCLRIREKKYLVVYNPYSLFYHYESKSRGLEDTKEKVERFNKEFAFFVHRWSKLLNETDIYYNKNLTLRQNNFALRNLKYEKIGEPFPIPKEIKEIIKNNYE